MTTDQMIQLGGVIVPVVVALGGAWAWHSRRRSLHIYLRSIVDEPAYIYGVTASNCGVYISSAAVWARIVIHNNTAEHLLISEIRAYEQGSAPRPVINFPVGQFKFDFFEKKSSASEPITMPLTIESGRGLDFWVLIEVRIPENVGEPLFRLFGRQAREVQTVKKFILAREEIEKQLGKKITSDPRFAKALGVNVTKFQIPQFTANSPLLSLENNMVCLKPIFGFLPKGAGVDILCEFATTKSSSPLAAGYQQYLIEIVAAGDKVYRNAVATNNNALWFLLSDKRVVPEKKARFV